MLEEGWIKIHRKIARKGLAQLPDHFSVWIHLLLMAGHQEKEMIVNGSTLRLKAGQLISSRLKISQQSGVQESKVERILTYLKTEQQIEQVNLKTCRLISIVNWDYYQVSEQQSEQQVNSERTGREQVVNTNKNVKNTKNEKNKNLEACAEVSKNSASPPSPVVFTFPVVGRKNGNLISEWPLTEAKIAEYRESYPNLDVISELKKAVQWCRDNQSNRKTYDGMPSFLSRWLSRATNQGSRVGISSQKEPEEERFRRIANRLER